MVVSWPIRYVRFKDSVFGYNRNWFKEFMDLYDRRIGLPFNCFLEDIFIDEERIRRLKASGLHKTVVGIQGVNEKIRKEILGRASISLNLEETLLALSISSTTNPTAQSAMRELPRLKGCELHLTHLPNPGDERGLRRLGVNLTCDPRFATNKLFVS